MSDRPQYIDRDGEVWTYGPDRNGDIGYHVEDGVVFPFAEDKSRFDGARMTFEDAIPYFGLIKVDDVTPAFDAYRRLCAALPAGGTDVMVDAFDLSLILQGWESWYRSRMDNKHEER